MRKVAFIKIPNEIIKLMIYDSPEGVYLFGYDCLQDNPAKSDSWYETLTDAYDHCSEMYKVTDTDWIEITDPQENCQQDFIQPVRVKGREGNNPQFGQFEIYSNGRWVDFEASGRYISFDGLTGNERLSVTGLMAEFDSAKIYDQDKARLILRALDFDEKSINKII